MLKHTTHINQSHKAAYNSIFVSGIRIFSTFLAMRNGHVRHKKRCKSDISKRNRSNKLIIVTWFQLTQNHKLHFDMLNFSQFLIHFSIHRYDIAAGGANPSIHSH